MANEDIKTIVQLHRDEWIAYEWIDITTYIDKERKFLRGKLRIPSEGYRAAQEWDAWFLSAYRQINKYNIDIYDGINTHGR